MASPTAELLILIFTQYTHTSRLLWHTKVIKLSTLFLSFFQDNNPMKRPKNEPANNYSDRSPPSMADIEEPPMDFSTTSGNNNNNNNNNNHSREKVAGSPAGSDIKPEPIELTPHLPNEKEDSGDSGGELEPGPPHLPPSLPDHDDSIQSAHSYLDSKLFAASGFQFSMAAALAADSLAGNRPTAFQSK